MLLEAWHNVPVLVAKLSKGACLYMTLFFFFFFFSIKLYANCKGHSE